MKTKGARAGAFTFVELLVTLSIVVLIAALFLRSAGDPGRAKAQWIKCINNLKNLGLAFRIYGEENSSAPTPVALTNISTLSAADYFRSLRVELSTTRILVCPADRQSDVATNFSALNISNVSFFANPLARKNDLDVFLFGDRNLKTNNVPVPRGSRLLLKQGMILGWSREIHDESGNIAMGDGSVQQLTSASLTEKLRGNVEASNHLLLIP